MIFTCVRKLKHFEVAVRKVRLPLIVRRLLRIRSCHLHQPPVRVPAGTLGCAPGRQSGHAACEHLRAAHQILRHSVVCFR